MALPIEDSLQRSVRESLLLMGIKTQRLNKNIEVADLIPGTAAGEGIELDLVSIEGSRGFFIEVTVQADKNRNKIKKFLGHFTTVSGSQLSIKEKLSLLGDLPAEFLDDAEAVTEWGVIYLSTSLEIIEKKIRPSNFLPNTIHIIDRDRWEYYRSLAQLIGKYAKYEFLGELGVNAFPQGPAIQQHDAKTEFIQLPDRNIGIDKADLYQFKLNPYDLLRACRVPRYRGLTLALEAPQHEGYQRFLLKDKLKDIAGTIGASKKAAFPTPITVVLSEQCEVIPSAGATPQLLKIPVEWGALEIIDGQHRLFAYAQSEVSEEARMDGQMLVTGIRFKGSATTARNAAARAFVSINRPQTRANSALADLLSYDLLGNRDARAVGTKILMECNPRPKHALFRVFRTMEHASGNETIPLTTVVNEMRALCEFKTLSEVEKTRFATSLGCSLEELDDHDSFLLNGRNAVESFFDSVSARFGNDWKHSDSLLMSAKYIAAMVRLLRSYLVDGLDRVARDIKLDKLKSHLGTTEPGGRAFNEGNHQLPSKQKAVIRELHDLFRDWTN